MTTALREVRPLHPDSSPLDRRALVAVMRETCRDIGADDYMVLDLANAGHAGVPRIVVANWVHDIIEGVGLVALRRLAESAVSTFPGAEPRGWHPRALAVLVECADIALLAEENCREIFSLKVQAGKRRYHAFFSADLAGAIDPQRLARAQITTGHALSRYDDVLDEHDDPLSERERECLFWVSEGKTTEEVSLILDVSSNTVNSYIAHAIHKLAAPNRAKAIATAIRRDII